MILVGNGEIIIKSDKQILQETKLRAEIVMKPKNPYPADHPKEIIRNRAWQDGFDAAIKWLKEPCMGHPNGQKLTMKFSYNDNFIVSWNEWVDCYPEHRYLCPECMKEARE